VEYFLSLSSGEERERKYQRKRKKPIGGMDEKEGMNMLGLYEPARQAQHVRVRHILKRTRNGFLRLLWRLLARRCGDEHAWAV
jgi:hypothetical protein